MPQKSRLPSKEEEKNNLIENSTAIHTKIAVEYILQGTLEDWMRKILYLGHPVPW